MSYGVAAHPSSAQSCPHNSLHMESVVVGKYILVILKLAKLSCGIYCNYSDQWNVTSEWQSDQRFVISN